MNLITNYTVIILFSLISFTSIFSPEFCAQSISGKFTIVIHGGAGGFPKDSPDKLKQQYITSLTEALTIGKNILSNGGTSLDAV
ncbi:MAG: isoaspartyl peptidase/L-asparaginase, partial [Ignavibacteria bacterium]|nr:isoaspartyl peptidase/L-asparaginase [Ignavibacteria bacterium]